MTKKEYSPYTALKDQVLLSVGNSDHYNELLSTLKEFFRDHINSPRRYEKITTICHLLRVLEIRDVLSVNNVGPLKEIAQRLPNSHRLMQEIEHYESTCIPTGYATYYAIEKSQSTPVHERVESTFINNNPNTSMSSKKKQRIINTIVEDIGISWKDLARGLGIKERIIDDLNEKHNEVTQKAKCIMDIYNARDENETTWFFDICDALETCRRKELLRKLKKIMVTNF